MKPVRVSVTVPQRREQVYDFLDVMANHESFTDHFLVEWECSGPERGVGSRARVRTRGMFGMEVVEIEVVAAQPPMTIVEENVGANGRRHATGTYTLDELPSGGTRIVFEYAWRRAPLAERLAAPLVRAVLRRGTQRSMRRLAGRLAALVAHGEASGG
ncbi:MAG TPA: SRPBCC family protein [Candidatus Dormibacteraeota bacterium]|nr:SRPBCC family protein [Candidatus Dormibacteraeota bacterium]